MTGWCPSCPSRRAYCFASPALYIPCERGLSALSAGPDGRIINPAIELRSKLLSTVIDDGPAIAVLWPWPFGLSTGPCGACPLALAPLAGRGLLWPSGPLAGFGAGDADLDGAARRRPMTIGLWPHPEDAELWFRKAMLHFHSG